MGTSVLEGAALKLPSVIIPHNMHSMDCDRFVYLQDTRDYCLGWYDTQMDELHLREYPLNQILQKVYKKKGKKILGEAAFDYYNNNHSIESATKFLVTCIEETTLTAKDFLKLTNFFFSKHRRYVFFGINVLKTKKNQKGDFLVYLFKIPLFKVSLHGETLRLGLNTPWFDKIISKFKKNRR